MTNALEIFAISLLVLECILFIAFIVGCFIHDSKYNNGGGDWLAYRRNRSLFRKITDWISET